VSLTRPPANRTQSDDARIPIELLPVPTAALPMTHTPGSATAGDFFFAGPRDSTPATVPLTSMILILLGGVALFVQSSRQDFLLGQLAAPALTIGAMHGLGRGGFRKIIMLAAAIALLSALSTGAGPASAYFQAQAGLSSPIWCWLVIIAGAVLAMIVLSAVVKSFRRRFIMKRPFLRGCDRLLGTLVGLAEGALVILTVCWTVVEIRPYAQLVRDRQDTQIGSFRHALAAQMVRLADEANVGDLGRFVVATNPIDDVPQIRKVVDELNTTGRISLDSLGSLDPETIEKLNEILKQTTGREQGGLDQLIETCEQRNETRDKAYRRLPPTDQR
jgi:hypothetical protein